MIKAIRAKTLLSTVKQPDTWFGLKYNMNLYRGCQHRCIYCDSRSECYQIDNFDSDVLYKENAIELLEKELSQKKAKGPIGFGAMNDPYMPLERKLELTRRALEVILVNEFPINIMTKSDLVLRDIELISKIKSVSGYAVVMCTVTTADDSLAKLIEPGAPSPTRRFSALQKLSNEGITTGISMMPILPFIEDNEENIRNIIDLAHEAGVSFIIPWFGMSLRDRQRSYYFKQLDAHFPGAKEKYIKTFGRAYACPVRTSKVLEETFLAFAKMYKIDAHVPQYMLPQTELFQ